MNKIQDFLFLSNYDLKRGGSIELNFVYNCEEYLSTMLQELKMFNKVGSIFC